MNRNSIFLPMLCLLYGIAMGQEMQETHRIALVIGNAAYKHFNPLRNTINDAEDMARELKELGYEVILKTDATQEQIEKAIEEYCKKLLEKYNGLFYYSGHGVEVSGQNYIIPIESQEKDEEIEKTGVNMAKVLDKIARLEGDTREVRTNIVILDACREKCKGRGFQRMDVPRNTMVLSATRPGCLATESSPDNRNSVYTQFLLEKMKEKDKPIEEIQRIVTGLVEQATNTKQSPYIEGSPYKFCLNPSFLLEKSWKKCKEELKSLPPQAMLLLRLAQKYYLKSQYGNAIKTIQKGEAQLSVPEQKECLKKMVEHIYLIQLRKWQEESNWKEILSSAAQKNFPEHPEIREIMEKARREDMPPEAKRGMEEGDRKQAAQEWEDAWECYEKVFEKLTKHYQDIVQPKKDLCKKKTIDKYKASVEQLFFAEKWEDCRQSLKRLQQIDPENPLIASLSEIVENGLTEIVKSLEKKVDELYQKGQWEDCRKELDYLLRLSPENARKEKIVELERKFQEAGEKCEVSWEMPERMEQEEEKVFRLQIRNTGKRQGTWRLELVLPGGLEEAGKTSDKGMGGKATESKKEFPEIVIKPESQEIIEYKIKAWKEGKYVQKVRIFAGTKEIRTQESQELTVSASQQNTYGLPPQIWEACQYSHQGEWILDMTTDTWLGLSVSEQQKYATAYQEEYAKARRLYVEKTVTKSGARFTVRLIPPGRFWMGSPDGEEARSSKEIRHRVVISKAFYIGKTEVTQGQWKSVMGSNPSYFASWWRTQSEHPVEQVSWDDCQDFFGKTGFQFPTEAQWEYACRSGVTRPFNLGENITPDQVNYDGNYPYSGGSKGVYRETTIPVGSLPNANAWGLYDMHGNVWEWCQDWYASYPSSDTVDPVSAHTDSSRVRRGGSWYCYAHCSRSSCRSRGAPSFRCDGLGLRCVFWGSF